MIWGIYAGAIAHIAFFMWLFSPLTLHPMARPAPTGTVHDCPSAFASSAALASQAGRLSLAQARD